MKLVKNFFFNNTKKISDNPSIEDEGEIIKNTKYNIYWVRHAESCANISPLFSIEKIYHPSLSHKGINQAILMGQKFINSNNINFDVAYSSPSTRTIMTALLSMRTFSFNNPNFKINIIPFISEKLNLAGQFDEQNKLMSPLKIKFMITLIKDWLENYWLIEYDDIEFFSLLKNINIYILNKSSSKEKTNIINAINEINEFVGELKTDIVVFKSVIHSKIKIIIDNLDENNFKMQLNKFITTSFLRGPKINLEIYKQIYDTYIKTPTEFNDFYTYIDKESNKNRPINIICFSHGSVLKEKFDEKLKTFSHFLNREGKLKNTSVILQEIDLSTDIIIPQYPLNLPDYDNLNVNKEKAKCFEKNTLNRAINKIGHFYDNIIPNDKQFELAEPNTNINIISQYTNNIGSMVNKINEFNGIDEYAKKYIKYKTKYLSLQKYK